MLQYWPPRQQGHGQRGPRYAPRPGETPAAPFGDLPAPLRGWGEETPEGTPAVPKKALFRGTPGRGSKTPILGVFWLKSAFSRISGSRAPEGPPGRPAVPGGGPEGPPRAPGSGDPSRGSRGSPPPRTGAKVPDGVSGAVCRR